MLSESVIWTTNQNTSLYRSQEYEKEKRIMGRDDHMYDIEYDVMLSISISREKIFYPYLDLE